VEVVCCEPKPPPAAATILVVDDHPVTREPLARLLRYEGFATALAANGVEALESVAAARPDLVLLDLMMPKMNGVDFLRNLRADVRSRGVPVIALTGSLDPHHLERLRELGVADVIAKARFTVDELIGRVRAQLAAPSRA
jgi:CheY-like chemotaxis protein